jgi:GntR family transcriptional regulator
VSDYTGYCSASQEEARIMTTYAITPHTRIDNSIIDNLPAQIGIYGLGIYVAIKRYLNTKTGDCYPSYKTIAKKLHIDRGTVIRYVKKMKELKIISPEWRFKEDGSHTSNQYNFQPAENSAPSNFHAPEKPGATGGGTKQPEVVVEDNQPSSTEPPEQSPSPNKKQRTITDVDFYASKNQSSLSCSHSQSLTPTDKQKTCPHPPTEIVFLADHVTICHHCYGLLDENLKLQEERIPSLEIVAA